MIITKTRTRTVDAWKDKGAHGLKRDGGFIISVATRLESERNWNNDGGVELSKDEALKVAELIRKHFRTERAA